jgi:hypothetical protein
MVTKDLFKTVTIASVGKNEEQLEPTHIVNGNAN